MCQIDIVNDVNVLVSINKYCLFSIVYCNTDNIRVAPNGTMKCDAIHTICLRVINSDNNVQKA
jgi:hypothetical protein